MKHISGVVMLLLFTLLLPGLTIAQDSDELACTDEDLAGIMDQAAELLAVAQSLTGTEALDALVDVKATLATAERCRGLDFEGDARTVYDPITIPDGLYRVTLTTEGFVIVEGVVLAGTCREIYSDVGTSFPLIGVSRGEASTGAQMIFASTGCEVIWETSLVDAPFTVTFEKMR